MQNFFTNLTIFSVIFLGWALKKTGRLTSAGLKDLNAVLFLPLMPITFFSSALGFNTALLTSWRFVWVVLGGFLVSTLVMCASAVLRKGPKERRAVSALCGIRPNCIFIGLPLITMWLGQQGANVMLMYIACAMPYFNTVPLICSLLVLNGHADFKSIGKALIGTFTNPILIGGMLGLLVGGMGWTPLIPQWVMRVLKILGTTSTGLALMVIGASLVPENFVSDIKIAWPDMAMKLFVHPAIMMIALLLFPVENATMAHVIIVASALAPAFNSFVVAKGFGMDGDYAAMLIASSTLVSIATLLFWMSVVTHVF